MGRLLDLHEEKVKVAEVPVISPEVEMLQKYAEFAEAELQKLGKEYTEEDVVKVASWAIEQDLQTFSEEEKIAEYDDAGRIMARAFLDELDKEAGSKLETAKAIAGKGTAWAKGVAGKGTAAAKNLAFDAEMKGIGVARSTAYKMKGKAKNVSAFVKKHPYYVAGGTLAAGTAGGYAAGK